VHISPLVRSFLVSSNVSKNIGVSLFDKPQEKWSLTSSTPQSKKMTPEAEKFNGWMAMIGFVAAIGAYITTGQIIPGIF